MVTGYMIPSMNSMGLFLFGTLLWVPMWDILDKYVQIDNKDFGISEQYKLLYTILPSIDLHWKCWSEKSISSDLWSNL